ncbi:hypothetical protein Peternella1_50 [Winogradskyella phage Peternella_1]|uniref:Uncharacterized protein n=1 Tax=Winogradskyella phage Peternella_1 TaxID=2745699 RepID=A0A8E5EBN7_9CAUD|nr:hypothetical protein M1M32_gp50 [Winogradskyella phage Peternella_1]QQV91586.1 hypothetical protein Peternella1_50 [Winogradskyella phage Peternella_1]
MKSKGREIEAFGGLMDSLMKGNAKIQTHYAYVTEVDWEAKTATVKGLLDDLEFYDVLLGLGASFVKPAIDSKCLIGVILNNEAQTFLISATEIEAFEMVDKTGFKCCLNDGKLTLNGEDFEGIVKAPELKTQIDKNTLILQKIQEVFNSWVPSPQDGGTALKTMVAQFISLPRADLSDIKNDKIKHGNGN